MAIIHNYLYPVLPPYGNNTVVYQNLVVIYNNPGNNNFAIIPQNNQYGQNCGIILQPSSNLDIIIANTNMEKP